MKIKRNLILACLFIGFFTSLYAQTNLSVPLTDNVYQILEYSSLRGYIPLLPSEKPYTQKFVLDNLYKILESEKITDNEKQVVLNAIERIKPAEKQSWYEMGGWTNSYDEGVTLPTFFKVQTTGEYKLNVNDPKLSANQWFIIKFGGDITENFSYLFDFDFALQRIYQNAYAPNTFCKDWDAFQFALFDYYAYYNVCEVPALAIRMLPELCYSAFDDRVDIKFSRTRHEWGYGNGSLWLSQTAGPFAALETKIQPLSWLKTNFVLGSLEYENTASLKDGSSTFQNLYTAMSGELNWNYFYCGIIGTSVAVKRFELGYINPLQFPFMTQSNYGDFDNVQLGLYLGFNIPSIMHVYANVFSDEMSFNKNWFHTDRNMMAYQAGIKAGLPFLFSTITAQYTKIEPYMYTHPLTQTPWYAQMMDTTYINHGDCIGYHLNPNSDEFRLEYTAYPVWYVKANLAATLVRHGTTYGSKSVDGSSFTDRLSYDDADALQNAKEGDLYWKDFLHDGAYEWITSVSLGATLDCRVWSLPIDVSLIYTFSYTTHSYGTSSSLQFINDDEYYDAMGNYFTIAFKIY